jgi:TolB-like protein
VVEVGLEGLAPFAPPLPGEKARPAARALPRRALAGLGLALALCAAVAGYLLLVGKSRLDPIRSIAVLPLENLSGDPAQEYFADGMTEALIGELAKLGALDVISRTSVMQYKGAHRPLREIAGELGVDGIIEGSVLRDGEQVRITAQLIDARSDHHLWSESYQRELRAVLAIQSEVARAVARQIELSLTPGEGARLAPPAPVDPRAQDAYFRGRQLWSSFTPEGVKQSLGHFEEAIRIAPDYALPHAAESSAWFLLGQPLGVVPHREALPKAKAAALRALALDEDLGDAHVALADALFFFEWDFEAAEREFRRASELSPSDSFAHVGYAFLLLALERRAEAYAHMDEGIRLSPLDPVPRTAQIDLFSTAGRFDDAHAAIDRILERDPASPWPLEREMRLLEYEGRLEDALATARKIGALQPDQAAAMSAAEEAWRKDGAPGYWRFWQQEWTRRGVFLRAAEAFAATGALDASFAALERAYAQREGPLIFLAVLPSFAPLHGDPRFAELALRMKLPLPAR